MLPHKSLRRADVVVSSLMMGFGGLIVWSGAQMPWTSSATGASAQWYLSPGLFPTVIGVLLILFSLRVLLTAIKEGGAEGIWPAFREWLSRLKTNRPVHRALLIVFLMSTYIFVGVGRFNFLLVSGIFLFVSIALFWWKDAEGPLWRTVGITAVIAAGFPFAITYLFSSFLYVPMP